MKKLPIEILAKWENFSVAPVVRRWISWESDCRNGARYFVESTRSAAIWNAREEEFIDKINLAAKIECPMKNWTSRVLFFINVTIYYRCLYAFACSPSQLRKLNATEMASFRLSTCRIHDVPVLTTWNPNNISFNGINPFYDNSVALVKMVKNYCIGWKHRAYFIKLVKSSCFDI